MIGQHNSVLSLITLGLAATLAALAGCAPATTPEVTETPVPPPPSSTPEVTQTPLPLPPPTLEVLDFRTFLPPAPLGFGKLAHHLLFFSNRSGTYELYQIDLDGLNLVQLTQNSARDMQPAWSVDGKIAFTSTHVNSWWEVFVVYPDSPTPVQITRFEADSWSLAWSPDGQYLAFVSDVTGDEEIFLVTPDGGVPVNLTQRPDANDFLPVWSPTGQQIAFVSDREGEDDVFLMAPGRRTAVGLLSSLSVTAILRFT